MGGNWRGTGSGKKPEENKKSGSKKRQMEKKDGKEKL